MRIFPRHASGKIKMAFRAVMADNSAMNADEVREKLREAIAGSDQTAASLSKRLRRSSGYLSDFLVGRKATLAAADSATLEKVLGLPRDSLLVTSSRLSAESLSSPAPGRSSSMGNPHTRAHACTPELEIAREAMTIAIEETYVALNRTPTDGETSALVKSSLEAFEAQRVLARRQRRLAGQIETATPNRKDGKEDERE
jgi:hypothetical protein